MSENRNLTIKGAAKGGKIVIIDMADYIEHCGLLLNEQKSSMKNQTQNQL